jgi:drug/metabolite transporter (DMT)-like permease
VGYLVVALAVTAALLYAVSDFLQQRAAQRARRGLQADPDLDGRPARHIVRAGAGRLVRDRVWFTGWVVGTLAYFVQATALNLGSVAVVQSLQVTTLLFALPLSTLGRPERPRARDLLAAAAVCLGLGLFLFVRGPAVNSQPHRGRILAVLALLAVVVAALTVVALKRQGAVRATLLAAAAGAAFASSATMVKLTSADLTDRGVPATATDWPGYTLALLAAVGLVLQQSAFVFGRLPTATTAMVVANPVVGTALAVVGFNERLSTAPRQLALMALAALLLLVGLTVLPRSPLLRSPDDPAPAERPGIVGQVVTEG